MTASQSDLLTLTVRQEDTLRFFSHHPASSLQELAQALQICVPAARRHLIRLRLKQMIAPAFSTLTSTTQGFVLTPFGQDYLTTYS